MSIKEYIGEQFAVPTGVGGALSARFMNFFNGVQYKAVEKFVCRDGGQRILDVGFGNGYMLSRLSKKLDAKLYGIDISADMLEKAADKNTDGVTLNKIMLSQASVTELPYNDDFFDTIYTVNTVYFWGDMPKAFEEILRVLKSGGNFICAFYSKDFLDKLPYCDTGFDKFTPSELRSIARENGLVNVKVKILKEGRAYCLIGEKL